MDSPQVDFVLWVFFSVRACKFGLLARESRLIDCLEWIGSYTRDKTELPFTPVPMGLIWPAAKNLLLLHELLQVKESKLVFNPSFSPERAKLMVWVLSDNDFVRYSVFPLVAEQFSIHLSEITTPRLVA